MVTPKIFAEVKRGMTAGHSKKSARKLTEAAIDANYKQAVSDFVLKTTDGIDEAARKGLSEYIVSLPNFGKMTREIETLIQGHLESRKFEIVPNSLANMFTVKW